MQYHKDQMLKHGGLFILFLLLAIGALVGFFYAITDGGGGAGIIISLLMLAYLGFMAWANASTFAKAKEQYNAVKNSGLLKVIETINPYPTHNEMFAAFKKERQNKIYEDDQIFLTDTFLGSGNFSMLIDGILDARVIVHKTNGVTEKVELTILYYDGEKTTFDYHRPVGLSGHEAMRECTHNLEIALNLIAQKSKLFRKYDCCRL